MSDVIFELFNQFPGAQWAPIPLRLIVDIASSAWCRQAFEGAGRVRHHFTDDRRAWTSFHGMANHLDRGNRRFSNTPRSVRDACERTDGRGSVGCDLYSSSAVRV
jgi:hypothetical protein